MIFIFHFLLSVHSAFATEVFEYNQSIRSYGMGGVHIPDDTENAIMLWNPAGLGTVEGLKYTALSLGGGINGLQIYDDLRALGPINGLESLSSLYGKNVWTGFGGHTTIQFPYFGISLFDSAYTTFLLHNPAYPQLNMTYFNDYGIAIGGAIPIGPMGYFGVNFKQIRRQGGSEVFGPDELVSVTNASLAAAFNKSGTGYGFDIGYLYKFPAPMNPAISIGWKDVGMTSFIATSGVAPEPIRDNLTLGITGHTSLPGFGFAAGVEYRHINNNDIPIGNKIHLGTELSLGFIDLRAGFYQGYTTYGVGLDLWFMQFEAASYSVERGSYPGQTPDARIQLGMYINLAFDPSFALTDWGGSKYRRLKQRR